MNLQDAEARAYPIPEEHYYEGSILTFDGPTNDYDNASDNEHVKQSGTHVLHYSVGAESKQELGILRVTQANASISIFHSANTTGPNITQVGVDVLEAKLGARMDTVGDVIPQYVGIEATANLVDVSCGAFMANLGVGANTEVGVKDQSVTCKVVGCGVQVGRILGISVFGSGFSIDFGKIFG